MGSTLVKGGTVVIVDLTYKANVQIENGVIIEIEQCLRGGTGAAVGRAGFFVAGFA